MYTISVAKTCSFSVFLFCLRLHHSGTKLVILSTLLAGGRGSANAKYEPLLSAIASQAVMPGDSGRVREFNLTALLPTSFESKFYTYPGSMTTPPCSQVVTWFVFEDVVKLSDDQLELLRDAQTYEVRGRSRKEHSS
jgi:carbonic anhydrase